MIRDGEEVQMHLAVGVQFWIVRKGEDPYKIAPEEVAHAISEDISEEHPDKECLFCGDGREIDAIVALRLQRIDTERSKVIASCVGIAGLCGDCAKHGREKFAELTEEPEFRDHVTRTLDRNERDRQRFTHEQGRRT